MTDMPEKIWMHSTQDYHHDSADEAEACEALENFQEYIRADIRLEERNARIAAQAAALVDAAEKMIKRVAPDAYERCLRVLEFDDGKEANTKALNQLWVALNNMKAAMKETKA
jgi:hypothetical protein